MVCRSTTCIIAAMLLVATLFVHLNGNPEFMDELADAEHRDAIIAIVDQRRQLALEGFVIGLAIALVVAAHMQAPGAAWNSATRMTNACLVGAITLLFQYFYYSLTPKNDWILRHLRTQEEIEVWIQMYTHMKTNYHIGAICGMLGSAALGAAL